MSRGGQARHHDPQVRAEPLPIVQWARTLPRRPLLICSLAVVAGVAFAHLQQPGVAATAAVAAGGSAMAIAAVLRVPRFALIPLAFAFLGLGGLTHQIRMIVPRDDVSHVVAAPKLCIEGTILRPPAERGWYCRVRVQVSRVRVAEGAPWQRASGRVEARIPCDPPLQVGDVVVLRQVGLSWPSEAQSEGDFDYRAWLARQGVRVVAHAGAVEAVGSDSRPQIRLLRLGVHLRRHVVTSIEEAMPGVDGALYSRLLVGMVYGLDASPLPEEVVEQFRRAGTVHLLVVSGAQISMIALAIVALTGRGLRGVRWWQALLAASAVLVLVAIVGMEASVGRALAMFVLVMAAALLGRDYDVHTSIAVAAAVILLIDPLAILSLSYQLTFAATVGVMLLLPWEPLVRLDGLEVDVPLPQVRSVAWGTFGAWLLTTPLLAHSVSGFAVMGNLANLMNIPLSALVLGIGFLALPLSLLPLAEPLLVLLCLVARILLTVVMHVNDLAGALPFAFAEGVKLSAWGCLLWFVLVAALLVSGLREQALRRLDRAVLRLHPSWPVVACFVVVALLAASFLASGAAPRQFELTLLPVGAGQCAVIRTPAGVTMVADCGGVDNTDASGRELARTTIVPWLAARNIRGIDLISISHWDADHYNALPHLLQSMDIGAMLLPPTLPDARPPGPLDACRPERCASAAAGGVLRLGTGVSAEVLAPTLPLLRGSRDDANNNSVVMMLRHGGTSMLLTGDLDVRGMQRLLQRSRASGQSLRAQVLVLPHHGRRLTAMGPLLDAVAPRWALVSCDRSADDYLTEEAYAELESRGIELLRTDRDGRITVLSDGRQVIVSSSRGSRAVGNWLAALR